jgi:phosphoserine phosphatase RsbU/P
MDVRHRFDSFAARFAEGAPKVPPPPPGAGDGYWRHVSDLFTRDVTEKGLSELVEQDAPETFQFFYRQIDFSDLGARPWYQRGPMAAWRVFASVAFRLNPIRRLLFAVAIPIVVAGWVLAVLGAAAHGGAQSLRVPGLMLMAATALALLLVLELRDKLALKGDLEIARQIQFGLLPFEPFSRRGTTICAAMRPANTVGGDYFDIIELGEDRIAVVIGDVAGKGIPAALLMALLQGSLRTLISAGLRGTPLVRALNDHLYANIPSNRLITLFYGELDLATGVLLYVNAGHNAPRVIHPSGVLEPLAATGVALAVVHGLTYDCGGTTLAVGDTLFLYTDGVTEAFDAADRDYGEERLDAVLRGCRDLPPDRLVDAVRDDVLAFGGPVRPRDDITLLAVSRGTPAS